MLALYRIDWTEHERGWGCRPDGSSFHTTQAVAEAYVKEHWARQPKEVPDEYTSPGRPYLVEITDKKFYKQVQKEQSVHFSQYQLRERVF